MINILMVSEHMIDLHIILLINESENLCLDETSDENLDEETLRELSEGLDDLVLAEAFSRSGLRKSVARKGKKPKKNGQGKKMCEFQLDEWVLFKMDYQSASLLFALRQKWQVSFVVFR